MLAIRSRPGQQEGSSHLASLAPLFCPVILTAVFAACALLVPAEAQRGHPATRKNQPGRSAAADGRKLFDSVCATCHGLDGRGGERGPNIATRPEVQQLSEEETLRILQAGIPATECPGLTRWGRQCSRP